MVSIAVILTLGLLAFAPMGLAAAEIGIPAAFLSSSVGGLVMAAVVFSLNSLGPLMLAAFCLGVITYMVQPAVNVVLFSVVPPEMKATTISASNVILNLAVAIVSFSVGIVSDAAGLRLAFGGSVLLTYVVGILVCLCKSRYASSDCKRPALMLVKGWWPLARRKSPRSWM